MSETKTSIGHFEFGMNLVDKMIQSGLKDLQCDHIECMSYNVSLDFVVRMFSSYPCLRKFIVFSNTEAVRFSEDNRTTLLKMIEDGKIEFRHVSSNRQVVHAKMYRFQKDGRTVLGALGSANMSPQSNSSFEILFYPDDMSILDFFWSLALTEFDAYDLSLKRDVPTQIIAPSREFKELDRSLLEGLWKHQQDILPWMVRRERMTICIPPGTGKTKAALRFIKYAFADSNNLAVIILVPTRTLVDQWIGKLAEIGELVKPIELENDLNALGNYYANPKGSAMVTLYRRFCEQLEGYLDRIDLVAPDILLILDECHNAYGHLDCLKRFVSEYPSSRRIRICGLSATIDSYDKHELASYTDFIGGDQNIYEISLQSFYDSWNDENETPVLKRFKYIPIRCKLSEPNYERFKQLTRWVIASGSKSTLASLGAPLAKGAPPDPAIARARFVRETPEGILALKDYIRSHIERLNEGSTIIFVQSSAIAHGIRDMIPQIKGWNQDSCAYVYDSKRNEDCLEHALEQFKTNEGFCLIAEHMLSEGFDIPKVSRVVLHGSYRSERDYVQKIGRALRYNKEEPSSIAEIVDVVFCSPDGEILKMEKERYDVLSSLSV